MQIGKSNIAFGKRLRKNKGAIFGLILICISVLLALFGYLFAPDNSPNANRMIPEIGSKKPGFAINLLREKREKINSSNWFQQLLNGKEDVYKYIPITNYEKKGDNLVFEKFIDEGVTEKKAIHQSLLAEQAVIKQTFLLGTDKFGRDILSRLIIGVRVSLGVGLIAVIISLTIGILLGSLAGYFRGWVDDVIMWFINVIWSIPTLLLVFAITLVLGKGFWQVFVAVGLTMWVEVARVIRGQVMSLREKEFILDTLFQLKKQINLKYYQNYFSIEFVI